MTRRPSTPRALLTSATWALLGAVLSLGVLAAVPDHFIRGTISGVSRRPGATTHRSGSGLHGMGDKLWGAADGGGPYVTARRSFDEPPRGRRSARTRITTQPLKILLAAGALTLIARMVYLLGQWATLQFQRPLPQEDLPRLKGL
ncbi:MAG TPA: hypothetical protein VEI97_01740 [bacterium]|nr:hypothetical protein [bacterium]